MTCLFVHVNSPTQHKHACESCYLHATCRKSVLNPYMLHETCMYDNACLDMVHVQYFELGLYLYTPLYSTCLLMKYSFPYVVNSNV